jgi:hypothetical protein
VTQKCHCCCDDVDPAQTAFCETHKARVCDDCAQDCKYLGHEVEE